MIYVEYYFCFIQIIMVMLFIKYPDRFSFSLVFMMFVADFFKTKNG